MATYSQEMLDKQRGEVKKQAGLKSYSQTAINAGNDDNLLNMNQDARMDSRMRGREIHAFIAGNKPFSQVHKEYYGNLQALDKFLKAKGITLDDFAGREVSLKNDKYNVKGKIDAIYENERDKIVYVIDWKTANTVNEWALRDWKAQMQIYFALVEPIVKDPDAKIIGIDVWLKRDGDVKLFVHRPDKEELAKFLKKG